MPEQTNPVDRPDEPSNPPASVLTQPPPRTRTMVFGLILLVVSGCVLIAQLTSINLDAGAVALTVMVIAGLLLVAGGRRNAN